MSLLERPSAGPAPAMRPDDLAVDRPVGATQVGDGSSQVGEERPGVVVAECGSTDGIAELLLAVASGDPQAFVTLKSRMGGLLGLNIRRVLRDAARSAAVTQELFAEVLRDAIDFDPDRDSAQAWLLMRAHHRAIDGLRLGDGAVRERTDLTASVAESVN